MYTTFSPPSKRKTTETRALSPRNFGSFTTGGVERHRDQKGASEDRHLNHRTARSENSAAVSHLPEELLECELVDVGVVWPEFVELLFGVGFVFTAEGGEVAIREWVILQRDIHRDLQVAAAVHVGFDVVFDEVKHAGDGVAFLLLFCGDGVLEGDGVLALAAHTGHGGEVDRRIAVADEAFGHVAFELYGLALHEGRVRGLEAVVFDSDFDTTHVVIQFVNDVDGAGHVAVDREAAEDAGYGLHRVGTGLRVVIAIHPGTGEVVDLGADRV